MKPKTPPDYPNRIKALRTRFDLTQARLAELIGVTSAAVSQWESGAAQPSQKRWGQIVRAEMLGVHALAEDFESVVKESPADYVVEISPDLSFSTDPEIVRLVMQGHRLAYGHQVNPTFATEISQIDPLPHQRVAVYERMLGQPCLRFLLADDAGAGKTIMAGLYVREMLSRRLIHRVLIVPPAGLVGNWESEMHTLFSLPFRVAAGSDAKAGNPFIGPESDLLIVSVDTLAGERMFSRLQEPGVTPYDLVIFDEAHKLSARQEPDLQIHKTNRYRLAETLAGISGPLPRWQLDWCAHHLLLLTATPHMGKDFPYYCLWRLLEPEALSTFDAFQAFPLQARRRHFVRRTKEEMVDFAGQPIYPRRVSDTLSYDLTGGESSEQQLYDETTAYIHTYYNKAKFLNRSAARLAMSVFQRRLASSTYALLCSLENRRKKLDGLLEAIHAGEITLDELAGRQRQLDDEARDVLDETTADEEESLDGQEQNEAAEGQTLSAVAFGSLLDLEIERQAVERLCDLAHRVFGDDAHEDSKFARLLEVLCDPQYRDEKLIIFTENRDTLTFLVRRLEQLGYAGEIAHIHGGMRYPERQTQVAFFRTPVAKGGARYLVATDAAGEGINLQFCWLMVNYDVPWNPARLEQRMGRIHRYGQKHDPVLILNLVAGKTREGKVLKTLLEKLEAIRKELGHGKVFDVVGQLFEGLSLKAYMEQALTEAGAEAATHDIGAKLAKEQVQAIQARERQRYGDDDVRDALSRLRDRQAQERYRKLLPGQVRRFIEKAAPLLDVGVEGDLDGYFSLRPLKTGALDPLWPALENYLVEQRAHLTLRSEQAGTARPAVFVRPGEPILDGLINCFNARFAPQARQGSVFVDPTAQHPHLFHLALIQVLRRSDPDLQALARFELLESRLVGLRQDEAGHVQEAPVEHLLLLRGGPGIYGPYVSFVARARDLCEQARTYALEHVACAWVQERRENLLRTLPERADFIRRGYDYREAELAEARKRLRDKARAGHVGARAELSRIKKQQRALASRREAALLALEREPELIASGPVTFLAHALVIPSDEPEDRQRYSKEVERVAVREARAYEEARGAAVTDVSTPALAMAAGLEPHPGFDLLSHRPDGEERAIEVKGRARVGDVELKENEWIKACTHQDRYWLYVVYDCATPQPRLWRVQNPFNKLVARVKGDVVVDEQEILKVAEP